MTTNNKAKLIVELAEKIRTVNDKTDYGIFISELRQILVNRDEHTITQVSELSDNTDTIVYILNELELLATTQYITDKDTSTVINQASLITIPVMFVGETNQSVPLSLKPKHFNRLMKQFRETNMCTKEDSVMIYNYLCTPEEILHMPVSTTVDITNAFIFQKDSLLQNLVATQPEMETLTKNTLMLRYLIGMFVSDTENEITSRDGFDISLKLFLENASNILNEALDTQTLILLPPYDFYESFRYGLDTYTVTGIKIQLQHVLTKHRIHPHGIVLHLDMAGDMIQVISKLEGQVISEIPFDISYARKAQPVLNDLMHQLGLMNIKSEDILIKNEHAIYPMTLFLTTLNNTQIVNKISHLH